MSTTSHILGTCACGEPIVDRETGEAIRDVARDVMYAPTRELCAAGHLTQSWTRVDNLAGGPAGVTTPSGSALPPPGEATRATSPQPPGKAASPANTGLAERADGTRHPREPHTIPRGHKGGALKLSSLIAAAIVALIFAAAAWAGSPHFISNATTVTTSGNTVTVTGKEAGLGDEAQIHVMLTATAECVNPGSNHPQAANKTSVTAEGDFPVQNGRADFTLSVTATFQPSCSPPMSVRFTDVAVSDTTNGLSLPL